MSIAITLFRLVDLLPTWVWGRNWVRGLMFAMLVGAMVGRADRASRPAVLHDWLYYVGRRTTGKMQQEDQ
jgi:hypothetical protein